MTSVPPIAPLPRVRMPHTVRDLGPVDSSSLLALLDRLSDEFWSVEDASKENNFEVFHSTQHVVLRFLRDPDDARTSYDLPIWSVLGPQIEPVLRKVVEPYGFVNPQFPKVMFARLAPSAKIDRHRDVARANHETHKIHVPLVSHPDIVFEVFEEFSHLEVGRAYEVNNVRPHGVDNPTQTARVHLIFEVYEGVAT